MKNGILICGIDPGSSGAIASILYDASKSQYGSLRVETMDNKVKKENGKTRHVCKTIKEIHNYFDHLINQTPNSGHIIYIEKISTHAHNPNDDKLIFKMRNLQKLQKNYNDLIACFQLRNFNYIEVSPKTWQTFLAMKKNATREQRKNIYKLKAAEYFPSLKPTLKTADALCILEYGRRQELFK